MKLLNIACGGRYHKDWINIDFHADSKAVQKVNILSGLPFKNKSIDKVKNKILYIYLGAVRFLIPKNLRDLIFVNTSVGEKHQWMYDRYSLRKIFENLGFKDIEIKSFESSSIPDFNDYFLDIKEDSTPYKRISSLHVKARK